MQISIALPIHDMDNGQAFLDRGLRSIEQQHYKNYEVVITKEGKMAKNTNEAIKRSTGDLIKILYMDDYLATKDALQHIIDAFNLFPKANWLASGCLHDNPHYDDLINPHYPTYNDDIHNGNNTIGSPSVVTIRKGLDIWFDEEMSWLLDCDFYKRMYEKWGPPILLNSMDVALGIGEHQMTHKLTDTDKLLEHNYIQEKYER
jgi:glycosyltransferase involved in cell wall biosynthesis